ncbi:uncharacterized protein [Paramisgurnus dabryanus]|uniref:uncharacterized protein n=1 Tax=Paramisgurnus dabryanus TaxID=90735 RepID=UPI0031F4099E
MLEHWILAMVVLLTPFHPELTESSLFCYCGKSCLDKAAKMQIKRVYKNTTAIIPCPHLEEDEELEFVSLYKEDTELHSADMKNMSDKSEGMYMVSKQNNTVSYIIKETISNNTGIYNCTIQTQLRLKNSTTTILLIKDAEEPTEETFHCLTLTLYIIGGVIITYNLVITVIAFVLGYKLKNKEPPENTYMNTRPAGFRRR